MSLMSSDIPQEVQTVLTSLLVIGGIPERHKFNIYNKTYVPSDVWIFDSDWWLRRGFRESGVKTVHYIQSIIDDAIKYGQKYPDYGEVIHRTVVGIQNGIENLRNVYMDEPVTRAQLEIVQQRIDSNNFRFTLDRKKSQPISINNQGSIPVFSTPQNSLNGAGRESSSNVY